MSEKYGPVERDARPAPRDIADAASAGIMAALTALGMRGIPASAYVGVRDAIQKVIEHEREFYEAEAARYADIVGAVETIEPGKSRHDSARDRIAGEEARLRATPAPTGSAGGRP